MALLLENQGKRIEALETMRGRITKGKSYEVVSEQLNYGARWGYSHMVTVITESGARELFKATYFKGL